MFKAYQKNISIPSIIKIGEGELKNIGLYLEQSNLHNIACFYSLGMKNFTGDVINKSLKDSSVNVIYEDEIDEINIENIIHTAFSIPKTVDALIGIGGGKALDYSKYAAHMLALPFVSVPTSTSNDGFCSPMSSLLVEGKRKTIDSSIPFGVIVDTEIIKTSPEVCIYSGIGDLLSKITAGRDWKQASEIQHDYYSDFAHLISQSSVDDIIYSFNGDIREMKFITQLVKSLLMNGLSMEIAGSSRPASGSEHLISHAYDKLTDKPRMHGLQVGLATYLCAYLQDNSFDIIKKILTDTGFLNYIYSNPLDKQTFIEAINVAPTIKDNFYTVLTLQENRIKAIDFVNNDPVFINALK